MKKSKKTRPEAEATAPTTKDLAHWDPKLRTHDPLELLRRSMEGRVPALVPIKYQRMCDSAFGFFRGAAPIMAADLSLIPNSGIIVQICGDAHVQNLGAYAGPDGRLIFDINDFDETTRAPFDFDVRRMATSILLAARQSKFKRSSCDDAASLFLTAYCDLMRTLARMPILEVARYQVNRIDSAAPISEALRKAKRETPAITLQSLTKLAKGKRIFKSDPPLLRPLNDSEEASVRGSLDFYITSLLPERRHFFEQYKPLAYAFKVVGTGSVGLRDYLIYMTGNGESDPLFLQVKEESASCYAPYLPPTPGAPTHQGQRVVEGQRAMQLQSDPLLGWTTFDGRDFLVRQLHDHKATVDTAALKPQGLAEYATVCGQMLARGHARSGDAREITAYIGKPREFKKAILAFAGAYAHQTEKDWKTLLKSQK